MSTLKVSALQGLSASSDAITLANDGTCTANITNNLSNRRLTINGAMLVAQRGQVTGVTDGFGGPDRYRFQSNHSAVTMSQSTDVPTGQGFVKSLKLDITTAGGVSNANTYTEINYRFEGQDVQSLCYGTSNAKTVTLSFWVKSPKTGTHWVRLYSADTSKFISRKYTVSSANTWQKVTLSFPGYTSEAFTYDNTEALRISWYFAQGSDYSSGTAQADDGGWLNWADASDRARNTVGQVNCFDSTDNDIYLAGVQLEVGSVATDFEHRTFAQELDLCERYYQNSYSSGNAPASSTGNINGINLLSWGDGNVQGLVFRKRMRAAPSVVLRHPTGTTTGKVNSSGTERSASAVDINEHKLKYIDVPSGAANSWCAFTYELISEL